MAQANPVKAAFATAHCASVGVSPKTSSSARAAPSARPVDLVHLSRQSLGDRSLEREILALFRSQSCLYLDRLENASTADERKMAAHTILGSARGLGAWQVAAQASFIQDNYRKPCDTTALRSTLDEANRFIDELLS